jgi:hypothetical protein
MTYITVEVDLLKRNGCIWCERLTPEWKKFVDMVKSDPNNSFIKVREYEASDPAYDKRVMEKKYEIRGVPTIMVNPKGGESVQYNGDRTAELILEFVKQLATVDNPQAGGQKKKHKKRVKHNNINDAQYELKYYKYKAKYLKNKEQGK